MTIEPYNYNDEPSGRSETLVQALEKIERLEKQLDIAKTYLKDIADSVDMYFDKDGRSLSFTQDVVMGCGLSANQALHDIKELGKCEK